MSKFIALSIFICYFSKFSFSFGWFTSLIANQTWNKWLSTVFLWWIPFGNSAYYKILNKSLFLPLLLPSVEDKLYCDEKLRKAIDCWHYMCTAGVHIIPFLIPNGIGVESIFRGVKVHFICHFELWQVFSVHILRFRNVYCILGVKRCK